MFGRDKSNDDNNADSGKHDSWSDDVGEFLDKTVDRVHNAVNTYGGSIQDSLEDSFPWISSLSVPLSSPFWGGREQDAENLWAFPVPSARQYDQCKDAGGTSGWNKEGVWRCLFGPDARDKNSFFFDYTGFLDWRREMYKAEVAKRRKERDEWNSLWSSQSNKPDRFISETEANRLGKKVVSSSVSSETVSKDDGTLETKRTVKRWYDDGTCSMNESVSTK